MKFSHVLATLHLAGLVAASPLYIVTRRPDVPRALEARAHQPQPTTADDPFGDLSSFFFGGDDPTTTSAALKTLPPPAIASSTAAPPTTQAPSRPSSTTASPTSTSSSDTATSTSTDTDTDSSSAPTSTDSSTSTSSTPPPTTTTTSSSSTTAPVASATVPPTQASSDGNGLPTAGIVVLVIFAVIILGVAIWAFFRYNPRARAWWVARGEKAKDERTYREALDGPAARFSGVTGVAGVSQLRQKALMDDGGDIYANSKGAAPAPQRKSMLQTFFAPAAAADTQPKEPLPQRKSMLQTFFAPTAAKVNEGSPVRRKPVQWGAPATSSSPSSPSARYSIVSEKMGLAHSAAPMGRGGIEKEMTALPQSHGTQRLSVAAPPDYGLPPMMPAAADPSVQRARRGSDGVYRLR